jgi:peptidoglycan hydrolase-like protein with peptidoglycan-binding domain
MTVRADPWWWSRRLDVRPTPLEGDDVRKVQRILLAPVTGVYDEQTAIRVRGWQQAKGLYVDGVVGPVTAERMTSHDRSK